MPFSRALLQIFHTLLVITGSTWARDLDRIVDDYPNTENGGYPTDFTRDIIPVSQLTYPIGYHILIVNISN